MHKKNAIQNFSNFFNRAKYNLESFRNNFLNIFIVNNLML
jgi:hypothetical protein